MHEIKGDSEKTSQNQFCFAYILAGKLPIFNILLPPLSGQDISKTKVGLLGVFFNTL